MGVVTRDGIVVGVVTLMYIVGVITVVMEL